VQFLAIAQRRAHRLFKSVIDQPLAAELKKPAIPPLSFKPSTKTGERGNEEPVIDQLYFLPRAAESGAA
jgi:hypothetical protein